MPRGDVLTALLAKQVENTVGITDPLAELVLFAKATT